MGGNYIEQHTMEISESSWILHAPSLSSYLHSHSKKKDSPSSNETIQFRASWSS